MTPTAPPAPPETDPPETARLERTPDEAESSAVRRRRLRFRSWHRGTREMDLVLGRFADRHLAALDAATLDAYEALLSVPDPELYGWLTGRATVPAAYDTPLMRHLIAAVAATVTLNQNNIASGSSLEDAMIWINSPSSSDPATGDAQRAHTALAASTGADAARAGGLTWIDRDARTMLDAARALIDADGPDQLSRALDDNLQIWVAIRAGVNSPDNPLPDDLKDSLRQLATYVATTTLSAGEGKLTAEMVQTMIDIDLNIAAGLTRGQQDHLIRERAYQLWEAEGRPDGRAEAHWYRAEAELDALLRASGDP